LKVAEFSFTIYDLLSSSHHVLNVQSGNYSEGNIYQECKDCTLHRLESVLVLVREINLGAEHVNNFELLFENAPIA